MTLDEETCFFFIFILACLNLWYFEISVLVVK